MTTGFSHRIQDAKKPTSSSLFHLAGKGNITAFLPPVWNSLLNEAPWAFSQCKNSKQALPNTGRLESECLGTRNESGEVFHICDSWDSWVTKAMKNTHFCDSSASHSIWVPNPSVKTKLSWIAKDEEGGKPPSAKTTSFARIATMPGLQSTNTLWRTKKNMQGYGGVIKLFCFSIQFKAEMDLLLKTSNINTDTKSSPDNV